jgi:hypothetical protein
VHGLCPYLCFFFSGLLSINRAPLTSSPAILHTVRAAASSKPPLPHTRGLFFGPAQLNWDAVRKDVRKMLVSDQAFWPADWGHYGGMFIRQAWVSHYDGAHGVLLHVLACMLPLWALLDLSCWLLQRGPAVRLAAPYLIGPASLECVHPPLCLLTQSPNLHVSLCSTALARTAPLTAVAAATAHTSASCLRLLGLTT